MKNGEIFRKLVELMFQKETEIAQTQSTPTCLQTRNFPKRMWGVLYAKKKIAACRWQKFFDTCFKKMLSSHEMYLTFVMFACNSEHECHQHIFESFISVCGLVKHLSEEILEKTGLNFLDLNPDIVKVFYRRRLKRIFSKCGGIQLLVDYIRDHRYLAWEFNENDSVLPDDPIVFFKVVESQMDKKLEEEFERHQVTEKETNPDEAANDARSIHLAKKLLSVTSIEFPTLPTYHELLRSMIEYRLNRMENMEEKRITDLAEKLEISKKDLNESSSSNSESKTNYVATYQENIGRFEKIIQPVILHNRSKSERNMIEYRLNRIENMEEKRITDVAEKLEISNRELNECSNSNSESNTNYVATHQENIERFEKIIQAVIIHNHSKSSERENPNHQIWEKAVGVLECLKNTIESVIKVLDEYDTE